MTTGWGSSPFYQTYDDVPLFEPHRPRKPRPAPDSDDLFSVQRNLYKAIQNKHDHEIAERAMEQAYKTLVRYLNEHG